MTERHLMRVRYAVVRGVPTVFVDEAGYRPTRITPDRARSLAAEMAAHARLPGEHKIVADLRAAADRADAWRARGQ